MKPIIAAQQINNGSPQEIFENVKKAMVLINWKNHVKGTNIFIKPNYMSNQVVPGQCTSPWVLQAVIRVVKQGIPDAKIVVGDADVSTQRQVEDSFKNWGIDKLCKKEGVRLVNLSKQKTEKVNVNGEIFKEMHIPKVILEADSIITVPVVKTHNVTTMSCALKNQWGCISRMRHRYHLVVDRCLAEINSFLKIDFIVADATICLEDNGPRVGKPKAMNTILASHDRVAMDTAVCKMMGINYLRVGHIIKSMKHGVGRDEYKLIGKLPKTVFTPAKIENHPIVYVEMILRKIPVVSYLLFNTFLFKFPAFIASRYNSLWWYNLKGKRYAREVIKKNPIYESQFKRIIK